MAKAVAAKATANARRVGAPAASSSTDDLALDDVGIVQNDGHTVLEAIDKQMAAELAEDAEDDLLALNVPLRDRFTIKYRPVIEFDDYNTWIKKAREKKGRAGQEDDVNFLKMAIIVLSNTCAQITYRGIDMQDEDGDPMTFVSHKLHDMFPNVPVGGTAKAIRAMYRSDGHCIQAMHRVLEAAGYSLTGDVEEVDPLEID